MIGAEGLADPKWMIEGQWIEYAKDFGAMCFYLEHRYYGKSHPTVWVKYKTIFRYKKVKHMVQIFTEILAQKIWFF
jgi:hypothetical protein